MAETTVNVLQYAMKFQENKIFYNFNNSEKLHCQTLSHHSLHPVLTVNNSGQTSDTIKLLYLSTICSHTLVFFSFVSHFISEYLRSGMR